MNTRKMTKGMDRAFTLVELLVVIGIIALLIAILMPALSRARKQALQVSCGSNERQVSYGALAYANDWKEQLPTRHGVPDNFRTLDAETRLPIIGFDSATVWDMGTYHGSTPIGLGGMAWVMRDYLKNDWDVFICPDGFYTRAQMLVKWYGTLTPWALELVFGESTYDGAGYLWLPHRLENRRANVQPAGCPTTDTPGDNAKTASDRPDLLLMADLNEFGNKYFGGCGASTGYTGRYFVAANHSGTSNRQILMASYCLPEVFPCNIGRQEIPDQMPLGQNNSRIDARTTWKPWQDWNYYRYAYTPSGRFWHSF